ncbi:MAG TPA: hypothetical protein VGQ00_03505 [Candidatus Norongarragalinales archaeon]|jgi:hypothetical protein|nr:hypothetical protein [Candidatus Norongarragalinales archaeon]
MSRGQVASLDVLAAGIVFLVVVASFQSALEGARSSSDFDKAFLAAQRASFLLLSQDGAPLNWSASNVQQLGIAGPPRVVQESLLLRLLNTSNESVARLLGARDFNLHFEMRYLNGTMAVAGNGTNASLGPSAAGNASVRAVWRELVLYKNNRTSMLVEVWK